MHVPCVCAVLLLTAPYHTALSGVVLLAFRLRPLKKAYTAYFRHHGPASQPARPANKQEGAHGENR